MRLLIVGTLKGQLTTATKIAMDKGATVTHAADIAQALAVLRSGRGADLLMVDVAIDIRELVEKLGQWSPIPVTYAGGANSLADLERVTKLGRGKVDLTIGSALDIFGGKGVSYEDCVKFNRRQKRSLAAD